MANSAKDGQSNSDKIMQLNYISISISSFAPDQETKKHWPTLSIASMKLLNKNS